MDPKAGGTPASTLITRTMTIDPIGLRISTIRLVFVSAPKRR